MYPIEPPVDVPAPPRGYSPSPSLHGSPLFPLASQ